MLRVCEKLREADAKGRRYGLARAETGYLRALVDAVADKDRLAEVELLKSLGDVNLEKGRLEKDVGRFNMALALYVAAMVRCGYRDQGDGIEHRYEYAERLLQGVTSKGSQGQEPQTEDKETTTPAKVALKFQNLDKKRAAGGNTDSMLVGYAQLIVEGIVNENNIVYEEHLQDGCRALQTGDLDKAEQSFAAALKSVHIQGQHMEEVETLYMLGKVYLKRGIQSKDGGDFTKAAALCNAALVRSSREDIEEAMKEITHAFVKEVLKIEQKVDSDDTEKHKLMLKADRGYVQEEIARIEQEVDPYSLDDEDPKIKDVEIKRVEAIKALCQTLVHQREVFIAGLVDECMGVMRPPPCKYAMIGLGSQATGLVTPYSDLEFALLVDKETEENVSYFRNLTHYLHLKVINLGETILPAMAIKSLNDFYSDDPLHNWFYDSVTPRGFAFDGAMPHACKTPLGRGRNSRGTSELIRTPSNMTNVLKEDLTLHLKKGYHLASILGNVSFITGDQGLVDEYRSLWAQQLQNNNRSFSRVMANNLLGENISTFQTQALTAELRNVKTEIYRFSSLAVSFLALLHNIQPTTIWETIQQLRNSGVIDSENLHHLMVLVSISAELRLRTYMSNRGQVENMSVLWSMSTVTGIEEKLQKVFYISNPKQLMRYYYTERPLKHFLSQLTDTRSLIEPPIFFDNSSELKAKVYKSLCDFENLKKCSEQTLHNYVSKYGENTAHRDVAASLDDLAFALMTLGDHKKAVRYYEQSLQMRWSMYGEGTAHPNIADSLNNLGEAWRNLGDHRKAISYYEQSLQMMRSVYGDDNAHPDIAGSLNNLGGAWSNLGDNRKAISYYEKSLQMKRSIYGEDTAHPHIAASLNNLGEAWRVLGDYRKAISYYEQSLQMKRSIYGEDTTHPDIAGSLNNMGTAWKNLGDYRKALCYFEQTLQMRRSIYGEETAHPVIFESLTNLGAAWFNLGDYTKAVSYYKQSLQITQRIYGEDIAHPGIAILLNNMGNACSNLGDYGKAISYYEQSLQMRRSIYGEDTAHPNIADSLNNLGATWSNLGDNRKAVSFYEQSLQMKLSIYGEDTAHSDIAASLTNLGAAWNNLGDHRKSVSYFDQALQMRRSIYGEDIAHPGIADSLNNMGNAWGNLGDYRKAISYYEQALQMRRSIYGEDTAHPNIAASLNNLGSTWSNLGDNRKAVSFYEQSLQMKRSIYEMRRSIYGKNTAHPDIADSLNNMGNAWGNLGDHRKAISYFDQALEMNRSIFGEDTAHPGIAASLNNLGFTWSDLGDHRKAISYYEQALQMMRSIYGKDNAHPNIASSLNNLGTAWGNIGDHRKAVNYHEQSLEMTRSIYGKDTAHSAIAASLNNLGTTWSNLGDHRKAISYHEQALDMTRGIYGEDNAHPDIACSLNNMGNTWGNLGDHRKAVSYFDQALEMRRSIHVGQVSTMTSPDLQQRLQDLDIFIENLMTCESRPVVGLTVSVTGQAVDNRTLFGVGSISKSFTSALLAAIQGPVPYRRSNHTRPPGPQNTIGTNLCQNGTLDEHRSNGYRRVYHRGSMVGFTSILSLYPSASGGVFTSMNGPTTAANDIHDAIHYQVADILTGKDHWLNSTTACTYPAPWWKSRQTGRTAVPKISPNFPRDKRDYEGVYGNHAAGNMTITLNTTDNKLYFSLGLIGHGLVLPTESANQILLRDEEPLAYIPTIVADVQVKGGDIFSLSLQSYPPEPPVLFGRGLQLTDPDPTEPGWDDFTGVSGSPDRTALSNTSALLLVLAYMFTV
uniref:Uncharacterized protein n=1 Tax=Branchiostoma floridae TaxID=7739 RepID=C3YNA0_BRAFL|eukprot:XP_002602194.1 hypothetical protein BRAFLDRAFT_76881 [Branchiostoma floridae]